VAIVQNSLRACLLLGLADETIKMKKLVVKKVQTSLSKAQCLTQGSLVIEDFGLRLFPPGRDIPLSLLEAVQLNLSICPPFIPIPDVRSAFCGLPCVVFRQFEAGKQTD